MKYSSTTKIRKDIQSNLEIDINFLKDDEGFLSLQ